jgi:hypothetical protein
MREQQMEAEVRHECTDVWEVGCYLCTCGEPWLNQRQICMSQRTPEWDAAHPERQPR